MIPLYVNGTLKHSMHYDLKYLKHSIFDAKNRITSSAMIKITAFYIYETSFSLQLDDSKKNILY